MRLKFSCGYSQINQEMDSIKTTQTLQCQCYAFYFLTLYIYNVKYFLIILLESKWIELFFKKHTSFPWKPFKKYHLSFCHNRILLSKIKYTYMQTIIYLSKMNSQQGKKEVILHCLIELNKMSTMKRYATSLWWSCSL